MPMPSLLDADGQLLPVWQFLAFHHALRRDAVRFIAALPELAETPAATAGFQAHWRNYRHLLEWHHEVEDQNLFPFMRQRDTGLHPLLDRLDAEHVTLDELLPPLSDAIDQLPHGDAADRAVTGLHQLNDLLEPHLAAEEQHLVPVMLTWFAEQPEPPEEHAEEPADDGPVPDAFMYPWTLECLDDHVIDLALAASPDRLRAGYPDWQRTYAQAVSTWA